MKIAAYSTDWLSQPVPDEKASAIAGKPRFVKGQKKLMYGGTYYYRLGMPVMELSKHGYESILTYNIQTAADGHIQVMDLQGDWHDDCDIIVFQRWMGANGVDIARRAMACGQTIINDVDDNFWRLTKTNVAYDSTDPIKNPTFNRDHYRNMIAASSAITVSTEPLKRELERLGPPVYVLRNAIDIQRWRPHQESDQGMIGWVGGIQWRAHDLHVLKPVLPDFLEDNHLPFYHGGDSQVDVQARLVPRMQESFKMCGLQFNPPAEQTKLVPKAYEQIGIDPTRVQCVVEPLVNIQQYPTLWNHVSVALIPLEDCAFNKSKSYLKALEASACGIPYIVSNLPEQRILIDEGGAGRIADNSKPKTWLHHLEALLDPATRVEEGQRNRAVAEKHDIAIRWTDWDEAYREIAS